MDGLFIERGTEDSQTDITSRAVTAKANLGDGSQPQNLRRWGSSAIRARNEASNAGDGEIAGRSSSALQSVRNSSARKRQEAQPDRCSSTAWRSAGLARPSRYSTNLLSSAAHCFRLLFSLPNIGPSLPHRTSNPACAKNSPQKKSGGLSAAVSRHSIHPHRRTHEWRQLDAQRFISSEQQRFQRAFRTFQDARDFVIIQFLILVQQHRCPLFFRERMYRFQNHFRAAARHEFLLHAR